jgi:glycosyltransferase involved in cell wall biosynthesis
MYEKIAVIASILKPVNDTRLYEKLGLSMRESNKYQVNIIGFGIKKLPSHSGIRFHSLYQGPRLGLDRLLAPWKFLLKLLRLRPDLTVVCTPELLLPAVLYKIFFRTKLWYDVQENYRRNVQYQSAYPSVWKLFFKLVIWMTEMGTRPFIDQYLLAEKGYVDELTFVKGKHIILENKYHKLDVSRHTSANDKVHLVFTGTVTRENGIIAAISLVQALDYKQYPVQLTIVGQVPEAQLLHQIKNLMDQHEHLIKLVGGANLVSHQDIMQYAANADFGLVAHQPNPSTENCIPTKIYEYLGLGLPMLLQSHALWESVVSPYKAAIILDYNNFQTEPIWKQIKEGGFYTKKPGPEITWEQEFLKLLPQLEN